MNKTKIFYIIANLILCWSLMFPYQRRNFCEEKYPIGYSESKAHYESKIKSCMKDLLFWMNKNPNVCPNKNIKI